MCFTDKLHEECGVFGLASPLGSDIHAAYETFTGLFALQHRGQEACGIAVNDTGVISCYKNTGMVLDVFNDERLASLKGTSAIGHVRYSTTGDDNAVNAQPIAVTHYKGNLAVTHNGNLTNAAELRLLIEQDGGIFHSTTDSETIAYTIVRERLKSTSIEEAVRRSMHIIQGAYSLLVMSPRKMIAARDPNGFRPLVIGTLDGNYIFASETCAIDAVGGTYLRDVKPGEIVIVEDGLIRSMHSGIETPQTFCSFEYIYFSRPDSILEGVGVDYARRLMGRALAKESGVDADMVAGVPDSGLSAACGYADESGIPHGTAFIKNKYIGRTFIQPSQGQRERSVNLKLNPLLSNVKGKRIVLIDDSIVRGTTSARIVRSLREAGAKEVHMRISAPPFLYPCYFGTDVPDKKLLIANNHTVQETAEIIGADSLAYLSEDALKKILNEAGVGVCTACFSGNYPIEPPQDGCKNMFEKKIQVE
ncbi:MAG: amidophosphoribosyltransferase [Clostridiales Family XIII bacterium]|jgi:amidophosphoribosyltransferase|nr:amidophosphoribosyltransferase [Clostridiales Family XIII bacterium]